MARLICIGDVHGHLDELNALLLQVQVRSGDRLVFLGDMVDRGPDSPGVIRRVRGLLHTFPGSTALLGNHESQLVQLAKRPDCDGWIRDITDEEFRWVTNLPVFTRDPDRNFLMVHGGLYPRYFKHYPCGVPGDWAAALALPRKQQE